MDESIAEVVVSPEVIATGVSAAAVMVTFLFSLAQLLFVKITRKTGIPAQHLVVVGSFLVAAAYVAYQTYVPTAIQANVAVFTSAVFNVQWVIYEGYKKFVKGK